MIIGGCSELSVGERVDDRYIYRNDEAYLQPFMVLRVASRQEWLDWVVEQGHATLEEAIKDSADGKLQFFYEVSVD